VASASADKIKANREIADLVLALGCGAGAQFDLDKLRYDRIVIMTDADVDGAHIASLLMTLFYRLMPGLIEAGKLYLAQPPLYRLSQGGQTLYARDEAHKDQLMAEVFTGRGKVDISRFKGLGEMPSAQLKETTMHPDKRTLLKVSVVEPEAPDPKAEQNETADAVERLMGRKPELRFAFIQERAKFVEAGDLDL
jgi:topoisomerase-4 subunit B